MNSLYCVISEFIILGSEVLVFVFKLTDTLLELLYQTQILLKHRSDMILQLPITVI